MRTPPPPPQHLRWRLACAAAALLVLACNPRGRDTQPRELRVFAASSLTEAFEGLAGAFEAEHEDVKVSLLFSGSQILRLQIEQGAAADVFASANAAHIEALVAAGRVTDPTPFADNRLAVLVPVRPEAGNEITSFSDLPQARRLIVGSPGLPLGMYTEELLNRAAEALGPQFAQRVRDRIASKEPNARLVRAKLELGEADAAIVYQTDAMNLRGVRRIAIPEDLDVQARYYVGTVQGSPQPELAQRWVELLRSRRGADILSRHGFLAGP